jgi:hypothetical protein
VKTGSTLTVSCSGESAAYAPAALFAVGHLNEAVGGGGSGVIALAPLTVADDGTDTVVLVCEDYSGRVARLSLPITGRHSHSPVAISVPNVSASKTATNISINADVAHIPADNTDGGVWFGQTTFNVYDSTGMQIASGPFPALPSKYGMTSAVVPGPLTACTYDIRVTFDLNPESNFAAAHGAGRLTITP